MPFVEMRAVQPSQMGRFKSDTRVFEQTTSSWISENENPMCRFPKLVPRNAIVVGATLQIFYTAKDPAVNSSQPVRVWLYGATDILRNGEVVPGGFVGTRTQIHDAGTINYTANSGIQSVTLDVSVGATRAHSFGTEYLVVELDTSAVTSNTIAVQMDYHFAPILQVEYWYDSPIFSEYNELSNSRFGTDTETWNDGTRTLLPGPLSTVSAIGNNVMRCTNTPSTGGTRTRFAAVASAWGTAGCSYVFCGEILVSSGVVGPVRAGIKSNNTMSYTSDITASRNIWVPFSSEIGFLPTSTYIEPTILVDAENDRSTARYFDLRNLLLVRNVGRPKNWMTAPSPQWAMESMLKGTMRRELPAGAQVSNDWIPRPHRRAILTPDGWVPLGTKRLL